MATNIPPHNLREVIAAVVKIIDNKIEKDADTTIEEILEIIKGPDFPTGGTIIGKWELKRLTEPDVPRLKCVLLLILSLCRTAKTELL